MYKSKRVRISNYKKYANEILDDIETYKLVLSGELKKFPAYFWEKPHSYESAREITRYLIEVRLRLSREELLRVYTVRFLQENRLYGMLQALFKGSPFKVLDFVYPNEFKEWELINTPQSFWSKDNAIKAVRWLIEEKLKWNDEDIIKGYNESLLRKYGLNNVQKIYTIYGSLNLAYPNRFKPWEIDSQLTRGFWTESNIKGAIKWLIEDKLKWNDDDIKNGYSAGLLDKHGLHSMSLRLNCYEALNMTYPNRFKEWELRGSLVRDNYWTKDNVISAVKWMIEDKLKWDRKDIVDKYSSNTLRENNLGVLLTIYKTFELINMAYPNEFKPWELKSSSVGKGYWTDELAIEAVRWLLIDKLKWSDDDIIKKYNVGLFEKFNLTQLSNKYNSIKLLNMAFPNKFKPWELENCRLPLKFWTDKNIGLAVKWLIDDKLKWNEEDVREKYNGKVLSNNNLAVINRVSNFYTALNLAYPNKFKPWELKSSCIQNNYWTDDRIIEAVKWLIEDKLKWDDDKIKSDYGYKLLDKYGLSAVRLRKGTFGSLNLAYPNRFKPEDLKSPERFTANKYKEGSKQA